MDPKTEMRMIEMLLFLNTIGWGVAIWLGKRQLSDITGKVDSLIEKIGGAVSREECDDKRDKIWGKVDALRSSHNSIERDHGERIARLEGPK